MHNNTIPFQKLFYMPISVSKKYNTAPKGIQSNFEYDVAVYGDMNNGRRQSFLQELKKHFSVLVISKVFGKELHAQLNKAKIVVNIHYYENALLETTRIYECLSLNKLIVSETSIDQNEHSELNGIVDFTNNNDIDMMVSRIQYWLSNDNAFNKQIEKIKHFSQEVSKFEFYFNRFLLSQDLIDLETFYENCKNYIQPQGDFWCLSMIESIERREDFDRDNVYGIWVFPGLRHNIGWVGCGLSYKFMTKIADDLNLPQVTICEDDVLFYHDSISHYQNIKSSLLQSNKPWDIFSGITSDLANNVSISQSDIQANHEKLYRIDKLISMVFNIYNKSSYSKVYNWNEKIRPKDNLSNTIDRYIQDTGVFSGLITSPFLVGHKEELNSTLWGHSNILYSELIERSQKDLNEKILQLDNKAVIQVKKSILLAMPDHVGLVYCIKKNLEYQGFNVTTAIISDGTIHYDFSKEKYYDDALFIRSDLFVSSDFLLKIRPYIKNQMIAYQWDFMDRFPLAWEAIDYFDKFFVFDKSDAQKHSSLIPITSFYFDYPINSGTEPSFDFYFIGCHVAGREDEINLFAKTAKQCGYSLDFEIVAPTPDHVNEWRDLYPNDNIRIGTRFKTFQENLNNTTHSRILVDFKTPNQNGLSLRPFEALGYKKKLITTNYTIKEYDFYHPNNIFVWDGKNLDSSELVQFLNKPYVEIDKKIYEKYSFKNWITYVLNTEIN